MALLVQGYIQNPKEKNKEKIFRMHSYIGQMSVSGDIGTSVNIRWYLSTSAADIHFVLAKKTKQN